MILRALPSLLSACLIFGAAARPALAGSPLNVRNPSFEENAAALVPAPGNFTVDNVPQWTPTGGAGLFNPNSPLAFAADGSVVAFLNGGQSLAQTLSIGSNAVTATPGARLSFTCAARGRLGGAAALSVDIRTAGGLSVAGNGASLPIPANTTGYSAVSATVTLATPLPAGTSGQPLTLVLSNAASEQINFDAVAASWSVPPAIASFSTSAALILPGQGATLSWSVSNASTLTLDGQDVTGQTSVTVTPQTTRLYTLTAQNPDGTATASVEVVVRPSGVRINEIMTENTHTLQDEDGDWSDWIELFNAGNAPADLGGWRLTDDPALPAKWVFPAGVSLAPGAWRIVFASSKNRTNPAAPLHTNFKLDNDGEFLALYDAAGAVVSEFRPKLPALAPDRSYGPALTPAGTTTPVVASGGSVKWTVPTGAVPDSWRGGAAFNDAGWSTGAFDLGFDAAASPLVTALTIPGATAGGQAFGGALGMDFDVLQPVIVSELGCFDDLGNGIAAGVTITVQLWSRNQNGTPANVGDDTGAAALETMTFTSASGGTLSGSHRFKPLASPRTLPAGAYTIVAYGYGSSERNGNSATLNTVNTGGGLLSFVGSSRYGTAGLFPATPDGGPAARYGAGDFRFRRAASAFATDLAASMSGVNATVLIRVPFTAPPGTDWRSLELLVDADDGFIAWINGVEIGRKNAPVSPAFNSTATAAGSGWISLDASVALAAIQPGTGNILAIQGLNAAASDVDFHLNATLSAEGSVEALAFPDVPTPGAANGTGRTGDGIVINEIHYDPVDSKSHFVEFVELYNAGGSAVDMGGWRLNGAVDFTLPAATVLLPHGYLVIGGNPGHLAQYLGVATSLGPWSGSLSNDGETLRLQRPEAGAFADVDVVAYEAGFPWPTVGDGPDASIQRLNEGLDPSLGATWRSAAPTPGHRNAVASVLAPPAIREVSHSPKAPTSGQPVTISAKITDPNGVLDATLQYQDVAPGNYVRLTDAAWVDGWTSLPMHDDGTAGDAIAGDSVFTAVLPGSLQQHRHLIRYRIVARDCDLLTVRVPYADDASSNFAFFCHDGVPAWTGAVQPGVTAASTFPEATMRKVRPWHLISHPADVQNCQYNGAYNDGTFRFEGAIVIDGRVYDHVHYRIKGQNSSFNTGKNKWKFQFNRGHWLEMPDDYGQKKTTVRTLNLSSVPAPWAPWNRGMAGLDEAVAFRLANLAGSPAPHTSYVHWRVIDGALEQDPASQYDGDLWGLYLAFENHDNNFKDEHGLADGNIFRMQATGSAGNHLLGQGTGQPGDLSDLLAFIGTSTGYNKGTVGNPASIQPESWFRSNVNLPRYFNWRAVTEAINQTDRRDQENVVYYRHPVTGQWEIYSWDVDLLYEQFDRWGPQATQSTSPYEQIQRALMHPAILTEFQNRARELQDLLLNSDQAWKVVDEFVSLITDETPRIIPNGGPIAAGFVEVERRRWDYWPGNPIPPRGAGAMGNYYKNPYPIGNQGLGPPQPFNRTLATPDFAGMVKWVKDFLATDAHGGGRLALMASGVTDPVTLTTGQPAIPIPATPTLTYSGPANHPLDALSFTSSAYSSPNASPFAAMQWRIGEIRYPGMPGFVPGTPWIYEIGETWSSGELPAFSAQTTVPGTSLAVGHTYRARVRHRDTAGRWSHWSAPVEFVAGAPTPGSLANDLVVSQFLYRDPSGTAPDWIELMNIHPSGTLSLTGLNFTRGITWSHSGNATLAPGGRLVLAANAAAFTARYGFAPFGEFSGALDGNGERLTLSYGLDTVLRDFTYDDALPWPQVAAGQAACLVLMAPKTNPDHASPFSWRVSSVNGGTPGSSDAVAFSGDPAADPDHDGWSALTEYALGASPEIAYSTGPSGEPVVSFSRAAAADQASVVMEVSDDLLTWHSGAPWTEPIAPNAWHVAPAAPPAARRYVRLSVRLLAP